MIDRFARELLASQGEQKHFSRAIINRNVTPLKLGETPATNEAVKYTDFFYTLKWKPSNYGANKTNPYLIKCDLFTGSKIRARNYNGLQRAARNYPWIKFLVEYTTISEADFKRANANQLIEFPFFLTTRSMNRKCERRFRIVPNIILCM